MIDRTLNYGRDVLARFLTKSAPIARVLDIGAGHGHDLAAVKQAYPHASLSAIECYPINVAELKEKGILVHSLDVERDKYPFEAESLDLVIGNQILEHTKELFWILDQVSRVLKVGGHLILGVPNLAALHNRVLLAFGRQPSPLKNNSAHVRGFTKPDLVQVLDSGFPGGYELCQFGGSNFYPFPPVLAKPLARVLPAMATSIFFDFRKIKPYQNEFLDYPRTAQLETNFYTGR